MGSQCSRLCCRPFRKHITIKQRVRIIYTLAPLQITESYCRNKASKIYEYLKDRRNQVSDCIYEFKAIISLTPLDSSAESERKIQITLYTVRALSENLKEFLSLTYNFIYQLMRSSCFSQFKIIVYETLRQTVSMYPDEDLNLLVDIMNQLIAYLAEPKNVSKHEIKLLSSIIAPLHESIEKNSFFDWKELVLLVLRRINSNEENEDELLLLGTFSKVLLDMKSISKLFLNHVLEYFTTTYVKDFPVIFKAVINGNKKFFIENCSEVVKIMIEYINKHEIANIVPIIDTLELIIKNSGVISTRLYSKAFKDVAVNIMDYSNDLGSEILKIWIFKTDVHSFFVFLKEVLLEEGESNTKEAIVNICKKKIDSEFTTNSSNISILKPTLDLIYEMVTFFKTNFSDFLLKTFAYIVNKVSSYVMFTKSDLLCISVLLIKIIKTYDCSLDTYKYILKIFFSIINQKNPEYFPILHAFILKLKACITKKNSFYIALILWSTIKSSGIVYNSAEMVEFVDNSVKNHMKIEPYLSLLTESEKFEKIMNNEKSMFSNHSASTMKISKKIFNFEGLLEKQNIKDFDESFNDDNYLGQFNSENEFSSVSSIDIQERIIDFQENRRDSYLERYDTALMHQEKKDEEIISRAFRLSV